MAPHNYMLTLHKPYDLIPGHSGRQSQASTVHKALSLATNANVTKWKRSWCQYANMLATFAVHILDISCWASYSSLVLDHYAAASCCWRLIVAAAPPAALPLPTHTPPYDPCKCCFCSASDWPMDVLLVLLSPEIAL